jgi:aminoglycoside phosphotransferase (APT) family kinase protein
VSRPAPGRLIATGRAADVYEIDDDWVLRRYRKGERAEREAEIMAYLRAHGYPVPAVRDAEGPDLVMERVHGPTMLRDLGKRPWQLHEHARTLIDLHRRLHAIPAPADLPSPLGRGDALIHRDLHPDNVMLGSHGPVVIDWTNAARGDEASDVAETWIVLAVAEVPGRRWERLLAAGGRGLLLRWFLAGFDRGAAARRLPEVGAFRITDRNMTAGERAAIRRLVERVEMEG